MMSIEVLIDFANSKIIARRGHRTYNTYETLLEETASISSNTDYLLSVRRIGNYFEVYFDGFLVGNFNTQVFAEKGLAFGLCCNGSISKFKDIKIEGKKCI